MKFTEAKLENAFTELLDREGYPHLLGEKITRRADEVLIEEDLRKFLSQRYAKEGITETEIQTILLQLRSLPSSDLYESNKAFMRMVSDGFILKREDRNAKDIFINLVDYEALIVSDSLTHLMP